MRIAWNGSLGFGLVNIPVGVAPATKAAARQSDVSFRLLHRECLTPVKQKRWCPHHDRELASDEIVRGLEVTKGQFVVVEDAELEAIEQHDDSRVIEIQRFVPAAEVDPAWMDRTYFLVPGQAPAQRRPYRLLLQAMRETETGALGRFVRSGRESLCLVRPRGEALALETLFLAEDVYSQAEIEEAVEATETKDAELDLARQIVQGLAGPFEPELLTSAYRRDLRALLDAKSRGESIAPAPRDAEPAQMGDLLEALKASVEAAKASAAPKARRAAKKASTAAAAAPAAKKAPGRGSTRR